ncbi:MAG: helix-turn-helix domain-containing protein [Endomicrobiia bacterium]
MDFSKIVKDKLKDKKMSVRALCKKIKLDSSFFSKVLREERNPPSDEKIIVKIAEILDIDPVKLIFSAGRIPEKYQKIFCEDEFIADLIEKIEKPKKKVIHPEKEKKFIHPISEELL